MTCCRSALPQDFGSFERHRSIRMARNDARSVVARRASCGYLGRIDQRASRIRAGLARGHGFEIRSASSRRIGVEFDSQFIGIEIAGKNLYPKGMPAIVRLDVQGVQSAQCSNAGRCPVATGADCANLTVLGCALMITRSGGKIMILRIFADGTGGGEFRSEPRHALADASQPFRRHTLFHPAHKTPG